MMNNNNNIAVATVAMPSQSYCHQAKRLLENTFPRVSCKAIDIIFRVCNCNFSTAFRQISAIIGNKSRQYDFIPKHVKVFIKSDRQKKQFEVSDKELLTEVDGIPELQMQTKVANTPDGQKLYKYSCSLVRIPRGRVHLLCTYSDENEDTVHWMLLPLRY
jgi:hypothetical protein